MLEFNKRRFVQETIDDKCLESDGTDGETTDSFITKSQLKRAVREILAEMLGIENQLQERRQWYDTDPAYELLGLDDPEQLRDAVRSGLLRIGHEVRDRRKPRAKRPRYQFHIEKCQKRLLDKPERRKAI